MDATILNTGLAIAMEFGTDWLQPIQQRLSAKAPALSKKELDSCNNLCRDAMTKGHDFIYKQLKTAAQHKRKMTTQALHAELASYLSEKYPWIDTENLNKLLSQGIYYAYKDGLHLALEQS